MWRRFHDVWYQGPWCAIACIAVVCAAAGIDVLAQSNLREQCFTRKDPAAQEACRSYVEESRFKLSDIISLGRELEKQSLYANAVVVYKQGLRYYPENRELLQQLHMAESFQNESARQNTAPDSGDRVKKRLANIECTKLQGAKALEACQRAIGLDPDNAALYERLGDVLTGVGQNAEASKAYQNARRLGRENAGKTGSAQAPARPEQAVPSKPSAEAVPSDSAPVSAPAGKAPLPSPSIDSKTLSGQLQLLDKLKKEGAISEVEYNERRTRLLDAAFTPLPMPIPEQPARTDDDRIMLADIKLGDFHALVIGNNDYKNIPKLESAIADAQAIGALLAKEYGFRVKPLINANRNQILSALSGFRTSLAEGDSLLIYYAGHGIRDEDIQRGYWLPIDAEANNPANWLSTTDIIDQVKGMRALHVLVVADSCFSATLLRSSISRFGRGNDQSNADRHALIRRLAKKRSRTVLTSGGLEPVLDSGGGQHSVFAKAFLNTLHENQGIMEGTRLFHKLRELVVYNADQTPEYAPAEKAGHEGGDFIFVRQP
jgi:tetratricopeptide (TPR) repeat protein